MTNPTPMTREQAWETVNDALFERHACDPTIDAPCRCSWPDDALAFLRTEIERLEGERRPTFQKMPNPTKGGQNTLVSNAELLARAEAAEAQLAQAREALRVLCDDVVAVLPRINSAEAMAWIHGQHEPFTGKSLPTAVAEARRTLEQGDKDA